MNRALVALMLLATLPAQAKDLREAPVIGRMIDGKYVPVQPGPPPPLAYAPPPPSRAPVELPPVVVTPTPPPIAPPECAPAVVAGLAMWPFVETLAVRIGPHVSFQQIGNLWNGQPLLVCAREENWFAISDPHGAPLGWSYSKWIVPAPPPLPFGPW
jgi:hypothetical protein